MELSDAERECRADAAADEQEDHRVHTSQHCGITIEYARHYEEIGPYLDLWRDQPYVYEIASHNMWELDALIDALTDAREWCWGPREDA